MKVSKILVKNKNTNYSIFIGNGAINLLGKQVKKLCPKTKKVGLVLDKNIPNKYKKEIKKQIKNYKVYVYEYSPNENLKSFTKVNNLVEKLLKNNLNRSDVVIAAGGGIIGDFAGFVASILKRGVNFINLPSTLLAQVDSSIGGKTGVNSNRGKNLIGSFYQPRLVISELGFLRSLSRRNLVCGFAEILKHSLIHDKKFFNSLSKNSENILQKFDFEIIRTVITKSCKIKLHFTNQDEREKNKRMILNFGHTFAHGIEAANNYSKKINHGEAVLMGIILATRLSLRKKICSHDTLNKIENLYRVNNLPKNLKSFFSKKRLNNIVDFMKIDKKNYDNKINLILLKKIGKTTIPGNFRVSPKEIKSVLKKIS
tara:strand:- start:103 stop:1212 length:1110 start_codon:yes stop_codon:yes gene_type:complete